MYQLHQLKKTGRYDAFKLKWHPTYDKNVGIAWPVTLHLFWDSDIAKWIESACYFLYEKDDADVDAAVKELVEMISTAQREDGYLNINYQVVQPGKEWTKLRDIIDKEMYMTGRIGSHGQWEGFGADYFLPQEPMRGDAMRRLVQGLV